METNPDIQVTIVAVSSGRFKKMKDANSAEVKKIAEKLPTASQQDAKNQSAKE